MENGNRIYCTFFCTYIPLITLTLLVLMITATGDDAMDSQAIVLDLDGTTLTSKKTVDPLLVQYLQTLRKRGILVFIATGRTIFEVQRILPKEFVVDGIVASNGMNIFIGKEQIYNSEIPADTVQHLIEKSIEFGISHEIYHMDGTLTAVTTSFQTETSELKSHRHMNVEWTDTLRANHVEKILFFDEDASLVSEWFENLKQMHDDYEFSAALSSSDLIDLNGAGATKAIGITTLLSNLDLDFENVTAFGDGGNDLPLFEKVGKSVAMKNARKEVQDQADEITAYTNNENGLYHHLQQLFH